VSALRASDAPISQYVRLGLPVTGEPGPEHLHVSLHADRAAALLEPLPREDDLSRLDVLRAPLVELLGVPAARAALERHVPGLVSTEPISVPAGLSLLDLARGAAVTSAQLLHLAEDLTEVPVSS